MNNLQSCAKVFDHLLLVGFVVVVEDVVGATPGDHIHTVLRASCANHCCSDSSERFIE